jgi:RNA polymerase sigma-70 factor (ECF subfamily)
VFSARRADLNTKGLTVERIHDEHADFVWRSLQRLGVRERDLEDALQESFIVVHKRLHTFDGTSRITTWLFGICLRVAAAQRRRAHVLRERASDEVGDEEDPDPGANPEATALASEARERLERVLDALTLEKRAVLVMFEIEEMSAGEIASVLGVPVGTVYSRLSAARLEFRDALARLERRERHGGTS